MGLLDGRKALIFGVANDHSIAWGIAKAFHEQGATVGFSSAEMLIEKRVKPLADSIGADFVEACDKALSTDGALMPKTITRSQSAVAFRSDSGVESNALFCGVPAPAK